VTEREQLEQAIAALEAQRAVLGDAVVEAALASMREKLAQAAAPTPDQQGERKLVTVMFADLSGFTALSEKLDPEHVRSLMNDCFNALVRVLHNCHFLYSQAISLMPASGKLNESPRNFNLVTKKLNSATLSSVG